MLCDVANTLCRVAHTRAAAERSRFRLHCSCTGALFAAKRHSFLCLRHHATDSAAEEDRRKRW